MMHLLDGKNYSLFLIPAIFTEFSLIHQYAVDLVRGRMIAKGEEFDNRNPRKAFIDAEGSIPSDVYAKATRARNVTFNTVESMPLIFATITLGNYARLGNRTLNLYALTIFMLRTAYCWTYIEHTSPKASYVRTYIWILSTLTTLGLSIQSAYNLM
jgi:uncharacterized MAPEG superfamily protein